MNTCELAEQVAQEDRSVFVTDTRNVATVEISEQPKKKQRQSSFTIAGKTNIDSVVIETKTGVEEVVIPATHRTNYWAVLKFMYLNAERKVRMDEFCDGVASVMREADPRRWDRFMNKDRIKTNRGKLDGVRKNVEQEARDWKMRLITNARNLCRCQPRENRLIERGHVLRYDLDSDGQPYFYLYLSITERNIAPRKRGRKPRAIAMA